MLKSMNRLKVEEKDTVLATNMDDDTVKIVITDGIYNNDFSIIVNTVTLTDALYHNMMARLLEQSATPDEESE